MQIFGRRHIAKRIPRLYRSLFVKKPPSTNQASTGRDGPRTRHPGFRIQELDWDDDF